MQLLNLFAQPVASFRLKEDLKKLEKYALSLRKKQESLALSNRGGFHSKYIDLKQNEIKSFVKNLTKFYNQYAELFAYRKPLNLLGLWINISEYKDGHSIHNHPDSLISGVFYIKAKQNSGNIVFYNQDLINYHIKKDNISEYNQINSGTWWLEPEENTLLLFPSWLKHEVLPNMSNLTRISISFNIGK